MNVRSKIGIRDFTLEDYDELISLWDNSELPYRPKGRDSRAKIAQELAFGCTIALVAEDAGKLVGSLWGTHDGRKGWLNRLAVLPEQRHQGIGRMLVQAVEKKLDEIGIDIIGILIEDWNTDSLQVFEKLGYKKHTDIFYYSKRKNPQV